MKGIGVAGGGGQPRPPQPPSRPRRRHILWGPRAAQTPTPPSPGTTRASAVRPGAARSPRPGAAGLAPGAAVQTLAPVWGGQRAPRGGPELPTGKRRMRPLLARWAEPRGCGRPGSAPGECRGAGRAPLGLHRRSSAPRSGCALSCLCASRSRSCALASGLREELLNIAVCLSPINKGKPLSAAGVAPFCGGFQRAGTRYP